MSAYAGFCKKSLGLAGASAIFHICESITSYFSEKKLDRFYAVCEIRNGRTVKYTAQLYTECRSAAHTDTFFRILGFFRRKYCRICAQCALVILLEQPACIHGEGRRAQINVESASEDLFILWIYRDHPQQCIVVGMDHAAGYLEVYSTGDQSVVQCAN